MKNEYPKLMEVSSLENFHGYKQAVVIGKSSLDKYVCLINVDALEYMGEATGITTYSYARDIVPYRELREAYKQGKIIQIRSKANNHLEDKWHDRYIEDVDKFSFSDAWDYRIKPESEYIPFDFSDAEFLIGKTVISKDGTVYGVISYIDISNNIHIGMSPVKICFAELFLEYTFLDGSVCGKEKN